jgi:peptidyl-prolyl cis-trans isomerase B (cyclophilin B)
MRHFIVPAIAAILSAALIASITGCPAQPGEDSGGASRVITTEGGDAPDGQVTQPTDGVEASGDAEDAAENGGESEPADGEEAGEGENGVDSEPADGDDAGADAADEAGDASAAVVESEKKSPLPPEGELWSYDDLGKNQNEKVNVLIETDKGNIMFEIYPEIAPKTAKGFLDYVNAEFYNGTYFHRIEKGFVAQGGNPLTSKEIEQVGYEAKNWPDSVAEKRRIVDRIGTVPDEKNYASCDIGTISLAKLVAAGYGEEGKAGYKPDSAGAEFFINTAYNDHLNEHFTVFGKVVAGMDVVNSLTKDDVIRTMRALR